jgi:hypothetical protein
MSKMDKIFKLYHITALNSKSLIKSTIKCIEEVSKPELIDMDIKYSTTSTLDRYGNIITEYSLLLIAEYESKSNNVCSEGVV